ncbi:MAG: electron transfer flavoprotein subunit beta/FixA family protein [Bacteroidetes bacterium]|nr:electron transfer flavoprotein subunit beta/FixA family protein [Bacteroidota bacterium]
MNILVCICKVPDTTTKIRFKDSNTKLDDTNVQFVINPLDEYAITRAVELKEEFGGNIKVISVDDTSVDPLIKKAFALGVDEGLRINVQPLDALSVATNIAENINSSQFDMILTGKETTDYNGCQVGAMLAVLLDLPFVGGVSKLECSGKTSTVERQMNNRKEVIEIKSPFVLSVQEGLCEPGIPGMKGIMSARKKNIDIITPKVNENYTTSVSFEPIDDKSECIFFESDQADELIKVLHDNNIIT